ncbi:hypothetical protein LCGC14_3117410, partial [marine sediment metagenome]
LNIINMIGAIKYEKTNLNNFGDFNSSFRILLQD